MMTTQELLLSGFIRAIEVLLANNLLNVIPDAIFLLCYQFYLSSMQLGIVYRQKAFGYTRSGRIVKYGIMDTQSQNIIHYDFAIIDSPNISCEYLINNIFNKLSPQFFTKHNYKQLQISDAIFCKYQSPLSLNILSKPSKRACILLFKNNKYKNSIIQYVSNKMIHDFRFIMYCDDRNSIYAEYEGLLYELKLSDIIDHEFEFVELNTGSRFWANCSAKGFIQVYLRLEYIQGTGKLFGIECRSIELYKEYHASWMEETHDKLQNTKCGIYDFDTNKWKKVATFEYKWADDEFACISTYDERLNVIYIQTNIGYTAKYDCDKDEWEIIFWNKIGMPMTSGAKEMGKLWLEQDVLKWAMQNGCGKIMALDMSLSEEDRKWVKVSDGIKPDFDNFDKSINIF